MKKILIILISCLLITSSNADNFKNNLENKFQSKFYSKIDEISQDLSATLAEKLSSNERIKYLDLTIGLQEKLKPTFEIQSVNKLIENSDSVWFNQTNIISHDSDTTINFGIGKRKLFNNETLMAGFNGFLDYQIDEEHFRKGVGFETVSNSLDLIGNYYEAISGFKTTDDGREKALDGYDLKLNYHLPNKKNTDLFAQIFEWENPNTSYEQEGEKYGFSTVIGNFSFTAGYLNDNKNNDGYFGNIKLFIRLGEEATSQSNEQNKTNEKKLSMRSKLFMPVQRENKIKVVKISKSGVKISGF